MSKSYRKLETEFLPEIAEAILFTLFFLLLISYRVCLIIIIVLRPLNGILMCVRFVLSCLLRLTR